MMLKRRGIFYTNGIFSDLGGVFGGLIGTLFGGAGTVPGTMLGGWLGGWLEGKHRTGRLYGTASIVIMPGGECIGPRGYFTILNAPSVPEYAIKKFLADHPEEIARCNICMSEKGTFYECDTGYAGEDLEPIDLSKIKLAIEDIKENPLLLVGVIAGIGILAYILLKAFKVIK